MNKKKKIAGAAASAVAGATVIGAAMKNNEPDVAQSTEVCEPQDILADAGELPEVIVSGTASIDDNGISPDVEITKHDSVETAQSNVAQPEEDTAQTEASDYIIADEQNAVEEGEAVAVVIPEETLEEEYIDDFDEEEPASLAMAVGANGSNNILEEIMDKAKETLGLSDTNEPDMPDFDNNADVGAFL